MAGNPGPAIGPLGVIVKPGNGKRRGRKLPEVLEESDQARLLALCEPADTLPKLRSKAILRLFLNTGLRSSELINLQVADIDWPSGKLFVRDGKGSKDRVLWIGKDDLALLKSYLGASSKSASSSNHPVFTSLDGTKKLCSRWLRRWIKALAEKAGLRPTLHLHSLRHSAATDLYRKTGNLRLVQRVLGHSSVATTEIYTHIFDREVAEAMKNLRNQED